MNAHLDNETLTPVYSDFSDDPDYSELLNFFVEALPERISRLQELQESGEFEPLQELAHQLKGAGGGYGFPGMTEAARELESACKEKNQDLISERLDQLTEYMSRIVAK
ncbi:MAG: Hpt domain-containing protein [Planctomycetes bacterium]|nr:Hpt domain-containing protein [Planctomycetota bacterium]